jgi:tripartite-type tricarboxylate transporter receptor subunit TctC
MRDLPYDPLKDFVPVIKIGDSVQTLVARNSLPASSVRELIAYAKKNPGKVTYASSGVGSIAHVAGELFRQQAGVDLVHVPYKGDAPAMNDVVAGFADIVFTPQAKPLVDAKKVKVLGVASAKRTAANPEWPTIAESGLPGFDLTSWVGIMAPAGTPREVVAKLNQVADGVIRAPAMRKRFEDIGYEPAGGSPEAFAAAIRNDIARFKKLDIKLE